MQGTSMKILTKIAFGSAVIASALLTPSARAADFVNGSFEDPAIDAATDLGVTGTDIAGWTYSDGALGAIISNGFVGASVDWHNTPAGSQYLYAAAYTMGGETIEQSVNLTAGSHEVSFLQADFGSVFQVPGGEIYLSILNSDNSELVAPTLYSTPEFSDFIDQTLKFDAPTDGDYTFRFTTVSGHAGLIDDVHLVGAVPEPATLIVVGLGFGGLLLRRRA